MNNNPYSTPATLDTTPPPNAKASTQSLSEIGRTTFLAWEKLRLLYIGLLGLLTLLLCGREITNVDLMIMVIFGGIVSNAFYFAGPILETYVRWLGYQGYLLRWILFTAGTLLTMLAAIIALSAQLLPAPN
jgi:hypothetical protein